MKKFLFCGFAALSLVIAGCNKADDPDVEPIEPPLASEESLVIVNAGGYSYSNASITLWNMDGIVRNEAFFKANDFKLGDVAQSATVYDGKTWIVVNGSNVIFAVDSNSLKETGRIDNRISSPRYIHFVSEQKAYVTQMYSSQIAIVDPRLYTVMGYIDIPQSDFGLGDGSTEEMVQIGDYVYVNLWSYGKKIVKIDTKTDKVVGDVTVGVQPNSLVVDRNFDIWTICDGGGWEGHPEYEAPTLFCIDGKDMSIKKKFTFSLGDNVSKLSVSSDGLTLYWINNHYNEIRDNTGGVYKMKLRDSALPSTPYIGSNGRNFYSLTVSPLNEDIFVADPLDYTQAGVIYRYSSEGDLIGRFDAGIIPTSYAWYVKSDTM